MKILIAWDIDSSSPSAEKTSFYRKMYGYTQERNGKKYEYEGLVDPSERLNDSVVEVLEEKAEDVIKLLEKHEGLFNRWVRRRVVEE